MKPSLTCFVIVLATLLFESAAAAGNSKKYNRFSDQDYDNDLLVDSMTYRDFLNRCASDRAFCVREIDFITVRYLDGRLACDYKSKEIETVSMGVVTLLKAALDKNKQFSSHSGDTLRGDVIGALDFLGKTCAERLKNAGG